jgi:hypothetical protein
MAKVTLLGSLASSVGGIVPTSKVDTAAGSVSLKVDAQVTAKAKLEVSAKAEGPKTKSKHFTAKTRSTNQNQIETSEDMAMKNSISNKCNWRTASLLGVPVDGSSN